MSHPAIHPEIKAFWEKDGLVITPRFDVAKMSEGLENYSAMIWDLVNDEYYNDEYYIEATVAFTFKDQRPTEYYYDGKTYSEAQMIGIARGLKAFL
jgi:hypothetical protein